MAVQLEEWVDQGGRVSEATAARVTDECARMAREIGRQGDWCFSAPLVQRTEDPVSREANSVLGLRTRSVPCLPLLLVLGECRVHNQAGAQLYALLSGRLWGATLPRPHLLACPAPVRGHVRARS